MGRVALCLVAVLAIVGSLAADAGAQGMGGGLTAAQICPPAQNGPANLLAFCPNCGNGQAAASANVTAAPPTPGIIPGAGVGVNVQVAPRIQQRVVVRDEPVVTYEPRLSTRRSYEVVEDTPGLNVDAGTAVLLPAATASTGVVANASAVGGGGCCNTGLLSNFHARRAVRLATRAQRHAGQASCGSGGSVALAIAR